ncbi:nuclear transport factor 2 family protein [Poseidonibacter ostreae]|jgi:hypothetical protein|uniref:DUF2358 domain-containing protein n=1 Tax=Poseidonibacter ostreae TaxID=2654171 RepID=A0ABQ6VQB7_9BACT|nr:nuclear transport factor 2 family protein [Poseidonibacter ostreae]KAB7884955.1 DUF2358 domain-containing protein [Poseidonibacter ostreae]KAB7892962.1 DUF2358 domain-containing protein [Poseidonibacter ostreae]
MNAFTYAAFFEEIDKNTSIEVYRKIFDKNVQFKDPFHDIVGVDKLYKIFEDMYIKLDNPSFKVTEIVEQNNIAYLKWSFHFSFKGSNKDESFVGVSRVEFNKEGRVISHIDYWDSASNLYEKIPILSFFMKFIKSKINS